VCIGGPRTLKLRGSCFEKFNHLKIMKNFEEQKICNRRIYWSVISLVALSCGGTALGQSFIGAGNGVATNTSTNGLSTGSSTNVTDLGNVTVLGKLDKARSNILPDLGATAYTHTAAQIEMQSQGADAPFNEVILRSPGVAQDSAANGDLHVRGEHANLQYRIDDVLLPEGISGFGLELSPRFVQSMQLITGSLPAQYGFRTAGIVDIQTKSGAFENGGTVEMYGGSHDTYSPSYEYGTTQGKWSFYTDGSYEHNYLGIENVTSSPNAIHDNTDQYKAFVYGSYLIDDTSRISVIGSASYADFQIPVNPNQQPISTQGDGVTPWVQGTFVPTDLNDNQNEQNYYGVIAYQKSAGDFNLQVSGFGRDSSAHYVPGNPTAALYYNGGVATDEKRTLYSGGMEANASYEIGDDHTVRGGFLGMNEYVEADTSTTVFQLLNGNIDPANTAPEIFTQDNTPHAVFDGVYLQDEWKMFSKFTVNYGARFDEYSSSTDDENQLSPRINVIYQPTDSTTLHAGYSRYFTPPPLETVPVGDITAFNNTSGASAVNTGITPVKAERANYYDAGITQKITPKLQVGLDGYYKTAQQQLDDGLFGQSLILSSFNYSQGRVYGAEFTASYTDGGFSSYANLALSRAQGKGAASAQFLWPNQNVVNYVNNNWINLDHDQLISGSFGVAYTWKESARAGTSVYLDAIYGSGLRQDGGPIPGDPADAIPNGGTVPSYYTVNVGAEQAYKLNKSHTLKARLDIVNLTDNSYELRSGTGVGVNAAQYGARIGFFGSLSYTF
jgi:outer membrane receptor protein involved in Fe transport